MLGRLLRVLIGFAAACLGAGIAMVLFVVTPAELSGLPPEVAWDRGLKALELAIYVGIQSALFAAPFALVVAAVGEMRHTRSWTFYAIAGMLMAALGFWAQHSTEQIGQPTIANNYALTAFITMGFVGGVLFWLFSGRLAGGRTATVDGPPATAPALHGASSSARAAAGTSTGSPAPPTTASSQKAAAAAIAATAAAASSAKAKSEGSVPAIAPAPTDGPSGTSEPAGTLGSTKNDADGPAQDEDKDKDKDHKDHKDHKGRSADQSSGSTPGKA